MTEHYLKWAENNKRKDKADYYAYNKWLRRRFGKKLLHEITVLDLEKLKNDMRKAGRAPATIRQVVGLVRHVYNKAIYWDLYDGSNPCRRVQLPKLNNARQRFLSRHEAAQLLSALFNSNVELALFAKVSLLSGMRQGELFSLKWGQVDLENKFILVADTKNSEPRHVYITDPIEAALNELGAGDATELVFKSNRLQRKRGLIEAFNKVVDQLGFNAGIEDRRYRVTFHTLRHTYASWAVMGGVPLYTVGKALGHKTASMTQRYAHLAPESQKEAFAVVANMAMDMESI